MTVQAQEEPLRFGASLHGGLSTTQVHGDQISGFNKFGYTVGASVDMRRSPNAGVRFGMFLTQKGSRRVPDPKNGDYTTWSYRFTYIDLPLMRVWDRRDGRLGVGVQPSILMQRRGRLLWQRVLRIDLPGIAPCRFRSSGRSQAGNSALWSSAEVRLAQSLIPISERPDQPVQRWNNFMMNMAIQWMVTLSLG